MIDLEKLIARWAPAFSGQADIAGISGTAMASLDTFLAIEEKTNEPTVTMLTAEARLMLAEIRARRNLHDQALEDLHSLVRLALELRTYGRARGALSETHEAWVRAGKPEGAQAPAFVAWMEARAAHHRALDRIEAIAVQLAGGDVGMVCGTEEVAGG